MPERAGITDGQQELGISVPACALNRTQARTMVLYAVDSDAQLLRPATLARKTAWLVGWRDDPGDPVFIAVGSGLPLLEREQAIGLARRVMIQRGIDANPSAPDFVFRPEVWE